MNLLEFAKIAIDLKRMGSLAKKLVTNTKHFRTGRTLEKAYRVPMQISEFLGGKSPAALPPLPGSRKYIIHSPSRKSWIDPLRKQVGVKKDEQTSKHIQNLSMLHEHSEVKHMNKSKNKGWHSHASPGVLLEESNLVSSLPKSKASNKLRNFWGKVREVTGEPADIKKKLPNFEYGKTRLSRHAKKHFERIFKPDELKRVDPKKEKLLGEYRRVGEAIKNTKHELSRIPVRVQKGVHSEVLGKSWSKSLGKELEKMKHDRSGLYMKLKYRKY